MRKQIGRREQKINECFQPRRVGTDTAPGNCWATGTTGREHIVLLWLIKENRGFSLFKKNYTFISRFLSILRGKCGDCGAKNPHTPSTVAPCVCVWCERQLIPLPRHKAVGPNRKLHTLPVRSVCVPAWLLNLSFTQTSFLTDYFKLC